MPTPTHSDAAPLPGQRMLHGAPYTFDQAVLNAHLADQQLAACPADLTALSWNDLTGLFYAYLNADTRRRWDGEVQRLGKLICEERASRPEYQRAFGRPGQAA